MYRSYIYIPIFVYVIYIYTYIHIHIYNRRIKIHMYIDIYKIRTLQSARPCLYFFLFFLVVHNVLKCVPWLEINSSATTPKLHQLRYKLVITPLLYDMTRWQVWERESKCERERKRERHTSDVPLFYDSLIRDTRLHYVCDMRHATSFCALLVFLEVCTSKCDTHQKCDTRQSVTHFQLLFLSRRGLFRV